MEDRHGGVPALFTSLTDGFAEAAAELGESRHCYRVAGRDVLIRFAGSALHHLRRPLSHLEQPGVGNLDADLEIVVWNGSGASRVNLPWESDPGDNTAITGRRQDHSIHCMVGLGFVSLFSHVTQQAVYWIDDTANLPYWEIAAPFRVIFHWWAAQWGGCLAHAAAVGRGGDGVLLVGRGGSGKSTTAVNCVDAGMQYVGDDYVLLVAEPEPAAYSLYNSAKIHTSFLGAALPHWRERVAVTVGPEGKSVFFVNELCPRQIGESLRLRAIVMPSVDARATAVTAPASHAAALRGLAPSTIFQLPDSRQRALAFLGRLTRQLRPHQLRLGEDLASSVKAIDALLVEEARDVA